MPEDTQHARTPTLHVVRHMHTQHQSSCYIKHYLLFCQRFQLTANYLLSVPYSNTLSRIAVTRHGTLNPAARILATPAPLHSSLDALGPKNLIREDHTNLLSRTSGLSFLNIICCHLSLCFRISLTLGHIDRYYNNHYKLACHTFNEENKITISAIALTYLLILLVGGERLLYSQGLTLVAVYLHFEGEKG